MVGEIVAGINYEILTTPKNFGHSLAGVIPAFH
jgi:hypothetical protein